MMTENFKASVQYGDWKGSAAADNADLGTLRDVIVSKGLMEEGREFLVGCDMYVGENRGENIRGPYIKAYVYEQGGHDNVAAQIASTTGPISLREVELDLTLEQFLMLFKRFNVKLSARGLGLENREFTAR